MSPTVGRYAGGMGIESNWPPRTKVRRPRKNCWGFSLLELMVVLVLLSLLMGLVTPALAGKASKQDRFFAAHQLYAELHRARVTAVSQQRHITVCPSRSGTRCDSTNQWHWGWIAFIDPDKSGQPIDAGAILARGDAQPQLEMTSGGRQRVRFQPQGTAYGNNLTIEFCVRDGTDRATALVVSNPGRIRITRGSQCA